MKVDTVNLKWSVAARQCVSMFHAIVHRPTITPTYHYQKHQGLLLLPTFYPVSVTIIRGRESVNFIFLGYRYIVRSILVLLFYCHFLFLLKRGHLFSRTGCQPRKRENNMPAEISCFTVTKGIRQDTPL